MGTCHYIIVHSLTADLDQPLGKRVYGSVTNGALSGFCPEPATNLVGEGAKRRITEEPAWIITQSGAGECAYACIKRK